MILSSMGTANDHESPINTSPITVFVGQQKVN